MIATLILLAVVATIFLVMGGLSRPIGAELPTLLKDLSVLVTKLRDSLTKLLQ